MSANGESPERPADPGGDPGAERLEHLLGQYVDRLLDGEPLDFGQVVADHPDVGEEIVRHLRSYVAIDPDSVAAPSLGTLGDYTLRRQIGRGGMGVVYEAWQNSLDRRVALKVLPAAVAADNSTFHRFMREAKTAGQLDHQNIVSVHALGIDDNTPYYAMELVEGETLAQIMAKLKGLDPEAETVFGHKDSAAYFDRLARAFANVARGLQHAHSKGVIHRDVKPSNLILDEEGQLRILDFGLAHLEGHDSLTASGDVVGTPLYMSPEQARRRKITIDHRTDVYSLGATMYEALTDRPPFRGKDHADTLSRIIERNPAEPGKLNPRVPQPLETIVLKCLRKDPTDRYRTAEALAQDLRRFVRGDPIEARPQPAWERLAARLRRHRARLAVAAVILVLVISVGWLVHQRQRDEYVTTLNAYRPAVLQLMSAEFSLRATAGWSDGAVLPRGSVVTREDFFSLREVGRSSGINVADLIAATKVRPAAPGGHYHLARAYRFLGMVDEARRALDQCDPRFVPAKVLGLEISGRTREVKEAGLGKIWSECENDDGWQRWWLQAYRAMKNYRWREAIRAYDWLIRLREEPYAGFFIEARMGRGIALLETREYFRAAGDFSIAGDHAPGLAPTLLLGKAWYLGGNEEGAEERFKEFHDLSTSEEKTETALWIAAVYGSLRDHRKGLDWLQDLGDFPFKERLTAYFFYQGYRTKDAIDAGRAAIKRNRRDPVAHLVLALALLKDLESGPDPNRARKLLEIVRVSRHAVELNPNNASSSAVLAWAEAETKQESWRHIMKTLEANRALSWLAPLIVGLQSVGGAQEECWVPKGDMRTPRYACSAAVVNGKIYIMGGQRREEGDPEKKVEEYDPATDTWAEKADMPTARRWLAAGVVNGRIYAIGGRADPVFGGGPGVPTVEVYDPATDTWTTSSRMRTARFAHVTAVVDGKIYAIGGVEFAQADSNSIVEEYDPATDAWTRKADMPTPRALSFAGVVDGKIYVIGGTTKGPRNPGLQTVEMYDPGLDAWTTDLRPMPTGRLWGSAATVNGEIYNIGGFVVGLANNTISRVVEAYNPAGDSWRTVCPLQSPRHNLAASAVDAKIYAIGGSREVLVGLPALPTVEEVDVGSGSPPGTTFRRGDSNADGNVNIADGVATLNFLFAGYQAPTCLDAADTDDSGHVDIADSVATFNWLFQSAAAPPPPGHEVCGLDPTGDGLSCDAYAECR